ncbi:zinc finger and BTB domain-containing protein 17-like [Ruditapes philippinarum]|uniref:zinc finger and BTB domain-containing protein 17-like n=1 Tax=Ruditapes philippinarum TaxID=129788 RepID=UPI00295B4387|nr:zinc finger and BTB domain-containing protein 17-like [Ruditapes philippinarum]
MEIIDVPSYSMHLLEQLNLLRQDQMFCDVTIACQNSTMLVHQVVLEAASPYFHQCIEKSASDQCCIDFTRFDEKLLGIVIDFLYSSKLKVSRDTVGNVMEICDELHLQSAVDACNFFIQFGNQKQHTENDTETDVIENETATGTVTDNPVRKKRKAATMHEEISPKLNAKAKKVATDKPKRTRKAYKPKQRKASSRKVVPVKITKAAEKNVKDEFNLVKEEENNLNNNGDEMDSNEVEETAEAIVKIEKTGFEPENVLQENEDNVNDIDDEDDDEDCNDDDSDTDDYDSNIVDESQNSLTADDGNIKRIDAEGRVLKKKVRKKRDDPTVKKSKKRRRKPFPCSMCSKTLTSKKRQIFHEYSKHGTPIDFKNITFAVSPCSVEASLISFIFLIKYNL